MYSLSIDTHTEKPKVLFAAQKSACKSRLWEFLWVRCRLKKQRIWKDKQGPLYVQNLPFLSLSVRYIYIYIHTHTHTHYVSKHTHIHPSISTHINVCVSVLDIFAQLPPRSRFRSLPVPRKSPLLLPSEYLDLKGSACSFPSPFIGLPDLDPYYAMVFMVYSLLRLVLAHPHFCEPQPRYM